MRNILLITLILLCSACTTTTKSSPPRHIAAATTSKIYSRDYTPQPTYRNSNETVYTVKPKDTIWKIAKKFSTSTKSLMQYNQLSCATNIKVGQQIRIPTNIYSHHNRGQFSWPVQGEVIAFFGEKLHNTKNDGVEINASAETVLASEKGTVIFCDYINGWGKTLILKHPENFYTIYANLENTLVAKGVSVEKKEEIGKVACTKNNADRILHFEIRKSYLPQDPLSFLE